MTLYKIAIIAGGVLCLLISGFFAASEAMGLYFHVEAATGISPYVVGAVFAAAGLSMLWFAVQEFLLDQDDTSGIGGSASTGANAQSIEQRMALRRERVAAAQATKASVDANSTEAPAVSLRKETVNEEEAALPMRLKLLNIGLLMLAGLGTMYGSVAQHQDPITFFQQNPVVSSLMICFVVYGAWRISGLTERLIKTMMMPQHERPKRKSYRTDRMDYRRERVEKARREGKI